MKSNVSIFVVLGLLFVVVVVGVVVAAVAVVAIVFQLSLHCSCHFSKSSRAVLRTYSRVTAQYRLYDNGNLQTVETTLII